MNRNLVIWATVLLMLYLPSLGMAQQGFTKGDINNDNIVDVRDVILCLRMAVGLSIGPGGSTMPTTSEAWAADVDNDKKVTSGDALQILGIAANRLLGGPPTGDEATFSLPGGATLDMVWIEPGTFIMGSPDDEPGRDVREGPQHEVTISRGFYLGKYELTQEQWESVMDTQPWAGEAYVQDNPNHPAVYISWYDVQGLIAKLNQAESSEVYRLPTEAEWEYACRAGTTTRWSFGNDESRLGEYAWYSSNTKYVGEDYAHAVGTKLPNPWGLYDMHGNVWEWVQDWKGAYPSDPQIDPTGPVSGTQRVLRSGDFHGGPESLRSARCTNAAPDFHNGPTAARLLRQGR